MYDVRIEIADPTLAKRTITAWFSDWTLDDVLRVVCTVAEARCSQNNGAVRIDRP